MTGWGILRAAIADEVCRETAIVTRRGLIVRGISNPTTDRPARVTVEGRKSPFGADLIVGADGVRSTVRRHVARTHPDPTYSGLLIWRTLIEESAQPSPWKDRDLDARFISANSGLVVTFGVPGRSGEVRRGDRRAVTVGFDANRDPLLRRLGKLDDHNMVRGNLAGWELAPEVLDDLASSTSSWRSRLAPAAARQIRQGRLLGTPLSEYRPTKLVHNMTCLVGDAAHAVGPVTGAGFHNALLDVQALTAVLSSDRRSVPEDLMKYESTRLVAAQSLVDYSQQWSRERSSSSTR